MVEDLMKNLPTRYWPKTVELVTSQKNWFELQLMKKDWFEDLEWLNPVSKSCNSEAPV